MIAAIVSALHVLAVALGLASVFVRGRALRGALDDAGLRRLFAADNAWGVAALLLNHVELILVVLIVFVASFMARGFGLR